jgi:hypothetical protein
MRDRARTAVLILAVLVLGHDLTFLAENSLDGLAVALDVSGHGAYWSYTWLGAAGSVALLGTLGAIRGVRLLRLLRGGATPGPSLAGLRAYGRRVAWLTPRLALVAFAAFVAQESAEQLIVRPHQLALGDFVSGAYAGALPTFVFAALLVSALSSLLTGALDALEAAVRALARRPRPARPLPSRAPVTLRRTRGRRAPDLGRAPPLLSR